MNMSRLLRHGAALFLAAASLTLSLSPARAQQLPLEAFGALAEVESVALSPRGTRLATIVNAGGKTIIATQDLDGSKPGRYKVFESDNEDFHFGWIRWVSEERLLVSMVFPAKRWGVDTTESRLLSVRYDGSGAFNLAKPRRFQGQFQPQLQDNVIDFLPGDGKHILMSMTEDGDPAVYRVNVEDGERETVHVQRKNFYGWRTDQQHRVRLGFHREKDQVELHGCDPDGRNWRVLWRYKILSREAVSPLGFGKDPNQLYILADHDGRDALFTVNLADPALPRKLILADPEVDVGGSLVRSPSGEAVGLRRSSVGEGASANYWDENYRAFIASIDETLAKRLNFLMSITLDGARYIVYSQNETTPGEYYLGDNRTDVLRLVARTYPKLRPADMAQRKRVSITARDGKELPSYLTLPRNADGKPLPAVVLVHGGPQSHDSAGFDLWAQFLANRGYAVLQVNFRGSTGFGSDHLSSGLRRWGMEMQDDLADATRWLSAKGVADAKRICIVGASFGGYAAIMGLAKSPELYKCGVSFAGVTDLIELGNDTRFYRWGEDSFKAQVGSLDDERERLRKTSPRYNAERIKAPLLLIHGTADRSVSYYQAQWMAEALEKAGNTNFRLIRQERGDHHLSLQAHSLQFFSELEKFLAQNL